MNPQKQSWTAAFHLSAKTRPTMLMQWQRKRTRNVENTSLLTSVAAFFSAFRVHYRSRNFIPKRFSITAQLENVVERANKKTINDCRSRLEQRFILQFSFCFNIVFYFIDLIKILSKHHIKIKQLKKKLRLIIRSIMFFFITMCSQIIRYDTIDSLIFD